MYVLAHRYASAEMRNIWSEANRIATFRRIWVAIAEAQWQAGLDRIQPNQIEAMRAHIESHINDSHQRERYIALEKETRHDIVAHIRLLGEMAPEAKDIIHLGATSCDITDNADLILLRESLNLVQHRLVGAISAMSVAADIYRDLPCLAYTHYQPAQLTTIGKRVCLWLADFISDLKELEVRISSLMLRGLKGATGTQDSYLKLMGKEEAVSKMEKHFAEKFGFVKVYRITGQTYSRKVDSQILSVLSGIGQTAHKFGTDMRLLQHDYEMQETFTDTQVGSSAMPYKRNPIRCERLCSLARYLVNECHNAEMTYMTQWLERSLDDSAGRRIYLPAVFYATDAILQLVNNISHNLYINKEIIASRVRKEMPFVLTEPLLVEAVKAGGDRTSMHAVLRDLCQDATVRVRSGHANPLWVELEKRPAFKAALPNLDTKPEHYVGLAAEQVRDFLVNEYMPVAKKYRKSIDQVAEIDV